MQHCMCCALPRAGCSVLFPDTSADSLQFQIYLPQTKSSSSLFIYTRETSESGIFVPRLGVLQNNTLSVMCDMRKPSLCSKPHIYHPLQDTPWYIPDWRRELCLVLIAHDCHALMSLFSYLVSGQKRLSAHFSMHPSQKPSTAHLTVVQTAGKSLSTPASRCTLISPLLARSFCSTTPRKQWKLILR